MTVDPTCTVTTAFGAAVGTKDPYSSAGQVQQPFAVTAPSDGDGDGGTLQSPPVTTTTVSPVAPSSPVASIPAPREGTYTENAVALSIEAKDVLSALVKKLSAGGSITDIGFAHDDKTLARRRAEVVAGFLLQHVSVRVSMQIVTSSTVDKVMVITKKV